MPRPTNAAPESAQDNYDPAKLEEAGQAAQQLQQLQAGYGQGRDLVNQLLGQAQLAGASEQFFRTIQISKLEIIKKNKLYQQLSGMVTPHGAVLKGTWEEYCNLLGRSVDMVDRDLANLQAFGEEALESMSRAGIGYRELRQFRKLPADQKTALIEAAKDGDKDSLLELAEDLIAKHAKEKETLTRERDDAKGNYTALDKLTGEQTKKIKTLQEQLIKDNLAPTNWDARYEVLIAQAQERHRAIKNGFTSLEEIRKEALKPLEDMGDDIPADVQHALNMLAEQMVHIHNTCAKDLEKFGFIFDRTLGSFTEARIDLYALPTAYTGEADDSAE